MNISNSEVFGDLNKFKQTQLTYQNERTNETNSQKN